MENPLFDLAIPQRLEKAPCSNIKARDDLMLNCEIEANLVCSQCFLVKYCGRDCQKAHWPLHKVRCKSELREAKWQPTWWREKRIPSLDGPVQSTFFDPFGNLQYLWGRYPSFDLLNLTNNEGSDYGKDLALCFAGESLSIFRSSILTLLTASGDLRNVVETVNQLPKKYQKVCTCVLNDRDDVVVCRNIILLLIAMLMPPIVASDIMLHIWYSARLKPHMLQAISMHVTPLVADVVSRIKRKSKRVILSKTWTFGSRVLSARLYKDQWNSLLAMISTHHDFEESEKNRRYIMLNETRLDIRESLYCSLPPLRRLCADRMRESGVLVPFGSLLDAFSVPNPTFFQPGSSEWLQNDSSDPIDSWPIKAVIDAGAKHGVPQEDLYGHLHFHIRAKLDAFCAKLTTTSLHFHLYSTDALALPSFIAPTLHFDRIDLSTLASPSNLGLPPALQTFTPLLHPPKRNPHATLLTLFPTAVADAERALGLDYIERTHSLVLAKTTGYVDFPTPRYQPTHPQFFRVLRAKDSFRDFDKLFAHYMGPAVEDFEKAARGAGARMKGVHSLIGAWPWRFTRKVGEKGAREAWVLLEASRLVGDERFVEWVRVE